MMGDVCLFMHAKTANSTISSLKTELMKNRHYYSDADFQELSSWLDRGKELYKKYGGKIFAVARVFDSPEEYFDSEPNEYIHWGSRLYADMGEIWHLQEPIDISEFIFVSHPFLASEPEAASLIYSKSSPLFLRVSRRR